MSDALTEQEIAIGLAGELSDTSVGYVAQRLSRWQDQMTLVVGDVFETQRVAETGPLGFAHMD
jgi:hypothetical protein